MPGKFCRILIFLLLLPSFSNSQNCGPGSTGYFLIEFDKDGNGNTIQRGQIIDANTYAPQGIHFQTLSGSNHPLVAFDTGNPVTGAVNSGDGDPDMGSPNESCPGGGPGIGAGGAPGQPGENCTFLGNVLIIEETWTDINNDGRDDVPDDLGGGGQFKITFDVPTTVGKIGFLDDIDVTVTITYSDNSTGSFNYSGPGENAYGEWDINADPNNNARNIVELTFSLAASGGIAFIETCKEFASVGDFVWHDSNGNGIQDNGESGIPDATVNLLQNGSVVNTTVTDNSGFYAFEDIDPDTYQIEFETPNGFTEVSQQSAVADSIDSDPSPSTGRTSEFTLNVLDYNRDIDAGFYNLGSVTSYVWHDLNGNGIQDNGEPAIQGATVKLSGGGTIISRTTGSNGEYTFTNLEPADYTVEFVLPSGYDSRSPQDQGTDDTKDSDANASTGVTSSFTLSSGQNISNIDAGFYQTASLGNLIWEDKNANGVQDNGELGLPALQVNLIDGNGNPTGLSTFTNLDGTYNFDNLEPGDYMIEVVYPSGLFISPQNQGSDDTDSDINPSTGRSGVYTLGSGESNNTVDGGLYRRASIGDYAWIDANANGIQDDGEDPAPGLTVTLFDGAGNQIGAATSTAMDGSYSFDELTPGDYYVQFSNLPNGAEFTTAGSGNDTSKDSDVNPTTSRTSTTTLSSGENDGNWDAGIFSRVSLGDNIWIDTNGDGTKDATDTGHENVLVVLKDLNGTQISQVYSDANGDYLFSGLLPGNYTVEIHSSNFEVGGALYDMYNSYDKDGNYDMATSETLNSGADMMDLDFGFASNLLLPVELISFNARGMNSVVEITWQTASEINNDQFVIERSADGSAFEGIGQEVGAGTSVSLKSYQFIDLDPLMGRNYYRLKQVDLDGSVSYSDVRVVVFNHENNISVYPTLVDTDVRIEMPSFDRKGQPSILLVDNTGQILISSIMQSRRTDLELGQLPAGIYFIVIDQGRERTVRRIMKR